MHEIGITTEDFYNDKYLSNEFDLLAVDYSGNTEFITAIEHKKYPFFGFAFHPEYFVIEFETYNTINIEQSERTKKIAI